MAFPDDSNPDTSGPQDDALFDEFGPVTGEAPAPSAPAELPAPHPAEVRVVELEQDLKELRDWATRVAADFDNYKKRVDRERQEQAKFSNERVLKELLPVLDNLQRAFEAAVRNSESPAIVAGVELVIGELVKVLRRSGVESIAAMGQPFDPSVHDALQRVETDAVEPGFVAAELQAGYTLHGRVLRPALVTVAAAPETTSPGAQLKDIE